MGALRTPFASALAGGSIVAVAGWIALAAGWVQAEPERTAGATAPIRATPAAERDGAGAVDVNEIYRQASPGVASIRVERDAGPVALTPFGPQRRGGGPGSGSGFVLDEEGRILTNAHVVAGADAIDVALGEDGETFAAKLVGSDPSTDIAVLEIGPPEGLARPLALGDSSQVEVGDGAVAIGNPFGLDRTATAGIVSAVGREISAPNGFVIREAIQTDAPINPGNSGGPLLDAGGRVIGVNSQIESPGGAGNVGIGFAVPIDTAREVARQLIAEGEVEHAFLGLSGADLTPALADVLDLAAEEGALVQDVVPGGPAEEAGIEAGGATATLDGREVRVGGDLIVATGGEPVASMSDVIAAVDARQPGEELALTVLRDGEARTVEVELAERPTRAAS